MMHGGNLEFLGRFVKKKGRVLERLEVCAVGSQVANLKSLILSMRRQSLPECLSREARGSACEVV
jgi:hypothetical protein